MADGSALPRHLKAETRKTKLSDLEQCLFALHFCKSNASQACLAGQWDLGRSTSSDDINKWLPRLERTAKIWCRLQFDADYLHSSQTPGMEQHYGMPISHCIDGVVCQAHFSRSSNQLKRMMWNSKIHSSGVIALAHSTASGMILFACDMFLGG